MSLTEIINFGNPPEGRPESSQPVSRRREWVQKFFLTALIVLVASLSFGIGRLTSPKGGEGIKIEMDSKISNFQLPISNENSKLKIENSNTVWASKNGKKYYYSTCSGLSRISEANKISFASAIAAEASGYTIASGCKSPQMLAN